MFWSVVQCEGYKPDLATPALAYSPRRFLQVVALVRHHNHGYCDTKTKECICHTHFDGPRCERYSGPGCWLVYCFLVACTGSLDSLACVCNSSLHGRTPLSTYWLLYPRCTVCTGCYTLAAWSHAAQYVLAIIPSLHGMYWLLHPRCTVARRSVRTGYYTLVARYVLAVTPSLHGRTPLSTYWLLHSRCTVCTGCYTLAARSHAAQYVLAVTLSLHAGTWWYDTQDRAVFQPPPHDFPESSWPFILPNMKYAFDFPPSFTQMAAPNMEYKRCSSCIPGLGALTGYYQPGQLSPDQYLDHLGGPCPQTDEWEPKFFPEDPFSTEITTEEDVEEEYTAPEEPVMAAALQKIYINPEWQLYTPKIVDTATAVIEMYGDI
ncbi:hypothetical protein LAZ67_14001048 [Cordylochernes scorpioides]|uniref:EGF-like domain-containing protein n=1 Tax=Cordylochernes scorpioides TaxID=51811 RepID=A0ABY6L6A6_9ARAC|nr:hypothetical protein LAZ67_14001048 [Cordylochernes scorpioides]